MRTTYSLTALVVLAAAFASAGVEPQRPQFPDLHLISEKGGVQTLRSSLGQATVLNFWATWCGPCRIELPELQQLYNELASEGVVVLAINVDSPRQLVAPFVRRMQLTLPVFFLEPEAEAGLGLRSLPTTVLLDGEGRVVNVWGGYSEESMRQLLQQTESLLAQSRGRGGK